MKILFTSLVMLAFVLASAQKSQSAGDRVMYRAVVVFKGMYTKPKTVWKSTELYDSETKAMRAATQKRKEGVDSGLWRTDLFHGFFPDTEKVTIHSRDD